MKTEDEARKCWCPFARVTDPRLPPGTGSWNRTISNDNTEARALCIASACMGWRWVQELGEQKQMGGGYAERAVLPLTRGYCGLMTRP